MYARTTQNHTPSLICIASGGVATYTQKIHTRCTQTLHVNIYTGSMKYTHCLACVIILLLRMRDVICFKTKSTLYFQGLEILLNYQNDLPVFGTKYEYYMYSYINIIQCILFNIFIFQSITNI